MKKSEIAVGGRYVLKMGNEEVTAEVVDVRADGIIVSFCKGGSRKTLRDGRAFLRHATEGMGGREQKEKESVKAEVNPPKPTPTAPPPKPSPSVPVSKPSPSVPSVPVAASPVNLPSVTLPSVTPPSVGSVLKKSIADEQARSSNRYGPPHVIVIAKAGSGKTTTLVEGLKKVKGLPVKITPSPQQAEVWKAMELSKDARFIGFCAFNKTIASELKSRVPAGCDAMTMHSMGFKAVRKAFTLFGGENGSGLSEYRTYDIIAELLGEDIKTLYKTKPTVLKATKELVGLCKQNLVPVDIVEEGDEVGVRQVLQDLADYYEINLSDEDENGYQTSTRYGRSFRGNTTKGRDHSAEVFDLVPRVIARAQDVKRDGCIDYDDMVWLPVVMGLPMFQYDLLLGDEVQDWNRAQQALAKKAGRRLILVGDPKQAIYGFAGADAESMSRMERELKQSGRGVVMLPLTVTRRCGKAIVKEANRIVPDFQAHESNPEGRISEARYPVQEGSGNYWTGGNRPQELPYEQTYMPMVREGDFILCRVNAPLVSQAFRFIRRGRKAVILGRNIGQGLVSTINKLVKERERPVRVEVLVERINEWGAQEMRKESDKKHPSEARMIMVQDKVDCLLTFCQMVAEAPTVNVLGDAIEPNSQHVIDRIQNVFSDDDKTPAIRLSSIHKAKGLEANRVFLLRPRGASIPHPMAKSAWQIEQEWNCLYIAITRAIEELVYVD